MRRRNGFRRPKIPAIARHDRGRESVAGHMGCALQWGGRSGARAHDAVARPSMPGTYRRLRNQPSASGLFCRTRSEEHTSELQSHLNLVCRLLLEKKKTKIYE